MNENTQIVTKMVEAAGHATQSLGVGRVLGQIYAYLYFSQEPQSLNDLKSELGISKGSASMGVRQLEQWGALEKVWVKGDRKDYYQAKDDFGKVIRNAFLDLAGKRIADYSEMLDDVETELAEHNSDSGTANEFTAGRVAKLRAFQQNAQWMWDNVLLELLSK